jgi:hypothetical protein
MPHAPTFFSRLTSRIVVALVTLSVVAISAHAASANDPLRRRSGHPYLTYSDANIARLQQRVRGERSIAEAWTNLLARADRALETNASDAKANELLCLAYRMTRDTKFGARVKQNLLAQELGLREDALLLQRNPPWHSGLGSGAACAEFGVAFDSVYDLLSPAERLTLAQRLAEKGILPVLDDWVLGGKRIHSLDTMGHNWWSAIVFGAGIGAIAIMDEEPRARDWIERVGAAETEWTRYAGSVLENKPATFDANGGIYESVNYANFGVASYLPFRLAWRDAFVEPASRIPAFDKVADFFIHTSYPRSASPPSSLNFGDGGGAANGAGTIALLWDLGYRKPAYLWYLAQFRSGFGGRHEDLGGGEFLRTSPRDLLYAPTDAEIAAIPSTPALPRSQIFPDMGWAALRSNWANDATLLGIKSGMTWNHAHADAGSFVLFHRGKYLLIDSGNSSYATPEYDGYYRQSVAHNVITFDGKAENPEDTYFGSKFPGSISHLIDGGDLRYVLADATGPTSQNFIRNFRTFLWVGDVILIIDDVKTFTPGQFEWLLHFNGEGERHGLDVRIADGDASVLVRPLFPEPFPNAGLATDYPELMQLVEKSGLKDHDPKVATKYFAFAPAELSRRMKFITAVIPVGEKTTPLPKIETFRTLEVNGVRLTQNGTVTEIVLNLLADGSVRHRNANLVHQGWETDAYLTALTWPEGANMNDPDAATRVFVADGSYLRREGKVVLDSLSKVFLCATKRGDALDVILQGQPVINAHLRASDQPLQVRLNGEAVSPRYDAANQTLRLSAGN